MLLYVAGLILIFVLLLDLIFYVKIKIHILISSEGVFLYVFSLPVFVVCKEKEINLLKNKISLEKLKNTQKEDLKIIESFTIEKLYFNAKPSLLKQYAYLAYPFIGLVFSLDQIFQKNDLHVEIKEEKKYYFYTMIDLKIDNIVKQMIQIRRLKHERASHQ